MTNIKELALRVAKEMDYVEHVCNGYFLPAYAQRFLAAYLAEQEPRGWWNPKYPTLPIQLTKPHAGGGWEPFFTAPPLPEPAPKEAGFHNVAELYKESTVCAAPSSEEVRIIVSRLRVIANAIADANYNELTMRIPAEPNRDADIVTMRAADLIERLAARGGPK